MINNNPNIKILQKKKEERLTALAWTLDPACIKEYGLSPSLIAAHNTELHCWTSSLHTELIQHHTLSSSYQWETLCCCYCMSTNGFGLDYNFISGIWVPTEELHNSHALDKCSLKLKNLKTVTAHITQSMV